MGDTPGDKIQTVSPTACTPILPKPEQTHTKPFTHGRSWLYGHLSVPRICPQATDTPHPPLDPASTRKALRMRTRLHRKVVRVAVDRRVTASATTHGTMLTTEELAQLLRVDPSTVRRWRTTAPLQGPPFIKMSDRVTLYLWEDVQEWLRSKRTMPGHGR
jgi:Helix-turn-helix domain